jgi:hypothetical protein
MADRNADEQQHGSHLWLLNAEEPRLAAPARAAGPRGAPGGGVLAGESSPQGWLSWGGGTARQGRLPSQRRREPSHQLAQVISPQNQQAFGIHGCLRGLLGIAALLRR